MSNVASRTYKKSRFCSFGAHFAPRFGFEKRRLHLQMHWASRPAKPRLLTQKLSQKACLRSRETAWPGQLKGTVFWPALVWASMSNVASRPIKRRGFGRSIGWVCGCFKAFFGLFVCLFGRRCWDGWTWHLYKSIVVSASRFKAQKTVAQVDFLCVLANFCQWCVCVIEIQVLSTHVCINSKMMRHATTTAFWLILGTNILASHHNSLLIKELPTSFSW